ncbi:hypothetical protein ACFQ1I_04675 [Kitasatospora arboriphila]
MVAAEDVERCFGLPRGYSDVEAWGAIEEVAGELPTEYKQFVAAYGPGVVGDFLSVFHPKSAGYTMLDLMNTTGPLYQALVPRRIPYDLHPRERGMVLWANTQEGDACFLIPRADGSWGIGVRFPPVGRLGGVRPGRPQLVGQPGRRGPADPRSAAPGTWRLRSRDLSSGSGGRSR